MARTLLLRLVSNGHAAAVQRLLDLVPAFADNHDTPLRANSVNAIEEMK